MVVVTHKFYLGTRGHNAANVGAQWLPSPAALTVVDERPDEAPSLDVMLSEAQAVREVLIDQHPETKEYMDALLRFMEKYSYAPPNKLYRTGIELDADTVTAELAWFQIHCSGPLSEVRQHSGR